MQNCDKTHAAKNWLEDLVVQETLDHILRPSAIKHISDRRYEIQLNDKTGKEENEKALTNIIRLIETGAVALLVEPAKSNSGNSDSANRGLSLLMLSTFPLTISINGITTKLLPIP